MGKRVGVRAAVAVPVSASPSSGSNGAPVTPAAFAGSVCPPAGRAASEGDDASTIQNAVHAMLEWDCVRCEEPTTIAKPQPVNKEKPFDKRKCNPCCSTDRILQRRKLMDNFKKKDSSDKKAY